MPLVVYCRISQAFFFFFIAPATSEIYTLSLHDALPISEDAKDRLTLARFLLKQARPLESAAVFRDRKSTRLNSSHRTISYAVFCLKKKKKPDPLPRKTTTRSINLRLSCRPILLPLRPRA